MRVRCPACSEEVDVPEGTRFCILCGSPLRLEVRTAPNEFCEEDRALLDKLLYNVGVLEGDVPSTESAGVIRALGNVTNVPEGYRGRVYATGSVTFAEPRPHTLALSCGTGRSSASLEAVFDGAATVRRSGEEIVVQTDVGRYALGADRLSTMQIRTVSRTPVAVVRRGDRFFALCEKPGYLRDGGSVLDSGAVYELAPLRPLGLGSSATITVGFT